MISDLKEIVEQRLRRPADLSALRSHFGDQPLDSPGRSIAFATSYCQAALPALAKDPDASVAAQGADLLINFLAKLPEHLIRSISDIKQFAAPSSRAWHEPLMDRYVGLCCVVHDIWAHLLGPESKDDANIVQLLLESPARRAIDFGAGAGHFAHELALHGVEVDAIEVDAMKQAFLSFRARHAGLEHLIRLGPRTVEYDLGLAIDVLDHMERPAEAVHLLATHLSAGGRLITLAAFPDDGWHQSDDVAIDHCGEALWKHFIPTGVPNSGVAWLDSFVKRRDEEPRTETRIPKLHPAAWWRLTESNEVVIGVDSRFCRSCVLNPDAAEVCQQFQGYERAESVAARNGVDSSEFAALCDCLRNQRLITWMPNNL